MQPAANILTSSVRVDLSLIFVYFKEKEYENTGTCLLNGIPEFFKVNLETKKRFF